VNGYLENLGTERLCDLKMALSNSSKGFEAVWPKWAQQVCAVQYIITFI
jgi:hypothetical protein